MRCVVLLLPVDVRLGAVVASSSSLALSRRLNQINHCCLLCNDCFVFVVWSWSKKEEKKTKKKKFPNRTLLVMSDSKSAKLDVDSNSSQSSSGSGAKSPRTQLVETKKRIGFDTIQTRSPNIARRIEFIHFTSRWHQCFSSWKGL